MLEVFFFNDTATTEIYTLSLHDALPISIRSSSRRPSSPTTSTPATCVSPSTSPSTSTCCVRSSCVWGSTLRSDRKSTRLNSSHANISYAVFCLQKKVSSLLYIVGYYERE